MTQQTSPLAEFDLPEDQAIIEKHINNSEPIPVSPDPTPAIGKLKRLPRSTVTEKTTYTLQEVVDAPIEVAGDQDVASTAKSIQLKPPAPVQNIEEKSLVTPYKVLMNHVLEHMLIIAKSDNKIKVAKSKKILDAITKKEYTEFLHVTMKQLYPNAPLENPTRKMLAFKETVVTESRNLAR